jgi:hypothetical protein
MEWSGPLFFICLGGLLTVAVQLLWNMAQVAHKPAPQTTVKEDARALELKEMKDKIAALEDDNRKLRYLCAVIRVQRWFRRAHLQKACLIGTE